MEKINYALTHPRLTDISSKFEGIFAICCTQSVIQNIQSHNNKHKVFERHLLIYQNQSKLNEIISILWNEYRIKQHTEYKSFAFLFSIFTNEHIPYRLIHYFCFSQNNSWTMFYLFLACCLTLARLVFFCHTLLINHIHNNVT